MAYEKGVVQGTVVEMQPPPVARVVSVEGIDAIPSEKPSFLSTEYPSLIEMTNKFESDLGVSGTTVEVVDAACKELKISTEGISVVERAHRAHDQLYGAPTQAAADQLDVEVSIGDGGNGGDSFEGVERVDKAARKLQDDRELRSDDENDGDDATEESPAIEEETSPTALQVDGGRAAPAEGERTRELFTASRRDPQA